MTASDPKQKVALTENFIMRLGKLAAILMLALVPAIADDGKVIMNMELITKLPDGSDSYSIRLQGIHLVPDEPFHGNDLGKYDYFLTVSDGEDGNGKLTIEFYEYETRKKKSAVVSEIVADVDFSFSSPAVFEAKTDTFGVDLAFSIVEK